MIQRILLTYLKNRLDKDAKSVLILGPRQVGKSTLVGALKPDLKLNFADEKTYRDHAKNPDLIRRQVLALKSGLIFIDEIQRIPSILNTIQALIDENKKYVFILTGSSARKLRRGHANLLPGRIFSCDLFPLAYWEIKDQLDLDRFLKLGGLPEVYLKDYGADLLRDYVGVYLREEIQIEALVRNLDSFNRFLDLAAEASGQVINFSKMSSDSEIPKETLRRYYDILEDTLLIHRISGFTSIKGSRKPTQKEKILFFDLGVRNSILGRQNDQMSEVERGSLFEQWFILQIIAWNSYARKDWKLFYYRDDSQTEVDLIIETKKRIIAIEVKYGSKIKNDSLLGLKIFAKFAKKPVTSLIIFRGDKKEKWDDITAVPYQDFLNHIEIYCKD